MPRTELCPHCFKVTHLPGGWAGEVFVCPYCDRATLADPPQRPLRARPVKRHPLRAVVVYRRERLLPNCLIAAAVLAGVWAVGSVFGAFIDAGSKHAQESADRREKNDPPPRESTPAGPSVQVVDFRAIPGTDAAGRDVLRVGFAFRNTGDRPVRKVKGIIRAYDANGSEVPGGSDGLDYTMYAAFNDEPGILPGETYQTPSGKGYILPRGGRHAEFKFQLTSVSEEGIPTN